MPNYLAPTPSVAPRQGGAALRRPGACARACRSARRLSRRHLSRARPRASPAAITLAAPITLWPFEIVTAEYLPSAGRRLQALGLAVVRTARRAFGSAHHRRRRDRGRDGRRQEAQKRAGRLRSSACRHDVAARSICSAPKPTPIALYEQLFAHCTGVYFRYLERFGDPVIVPRAPPDMLQPDRLRGGRSADPQRQALFRGFDFLRDYFAFPRKFLGFELDRARQVLPRLPRSRSTSSSPSTTSIPRLAAVVKPQMFALYAAPAVNLFEKTLDRIPVKPNQHEYQVVPDRSRARLRGPPDRSRSSPTSPASGEEGAGRVRSIRATPAAAAGRPTSTTRCAACRGGAPAEERKYGSASDYTGTDMFIVAVRAGDARGWKARDRRA